jgi:hypothetical protein
MIHSIPALCTTTLVSGPVRRRSRQVLSAIARPGFLTALGAGTSVIMRHARSGQVSRSPRVPSIHLPSSATAHPRLIARSARHSSGVGGGCGSVSGAAQAKTRRRNLEGGDTWYAGLGMHPRPDAPHSCVVMIAPAALYRTLTSRAALFLEIRDDGKVWQLQRYGAGRDSTCALR